MFRSGGRGRAEVGGYGVDVVGFWIERHGSCAVLGGDGLDDGVFVGRILMGDGDCAVAARCEGEAGCGIEAIGVHAFADRDSRDNFSGGVIDHGHQLIAAACEETIVRDVDRHSSWILAGSGGPRVQHFKSCRVECDDLIFIFYVDENMALAVGLCGFWLATERNCSDNFARGGVNCRGVFGATAVECENSFRGSIVENRVRVFAGEIDCANGLHFFHIENGDGAFRAEEGALEFGSENNGVCVMEAGDVGELLSSGVDDDNMIAARDEDMTGSRINVKIIPAAFAAESELLRQVVVGGVLRGVHRENACGE